MKIISLLIFLFSVTWLVFLRDFIPPNGFELGFVSISFYGLFVAIAVFIAWLLARRYAPRFGLSKQNVDDGIFWVVISGFIFSRLYFVAFEADYFLENPHEILAVWNGGLSIFGAMIGGVIGGVLYAKKNAVSFLKVLDLGFLVLPISQSIGRWGNYFNHETFGRPTELPWAWFISADFRPAEYLTDMFFHPVFLYESLWDLFIFIALVYLLKTLPRPTNGAIVGSYLALYGIGRFFLEDLRLDSFLVYGVKTDQIAALAAFLVGFLILIYRGRYYQKRS